MNTVLVINGHPHIDFEKVTAYPRTIKGKTRVTFKQFCEANGIELHDWQKEAATAFLQRFDKKPGSGKSVLTKLLALFVNVYGNDFVLDDSPTSFPVLQGKESQIEFETDYLLCNSEGKERAIADINDAIDFLTRIRDKKIRLCNMMHPTEFDNDDEVKE